MRGSAKFYLGSHLPNWLASAGVPLFISHRRLSRQKSWKRAIAPWALDSGGFSELSLYGEWRTSPEEYVAAVIRYDKEIGMLEWAAPQDWMCEDEIVAKTGLSVEEHQRRSVANFIELERLWHEAAANDPELNPESPFMPVLQGQSAEDYLRCWDFFEEAGVDLANYPLVGIGSVCRRQHSEEIGEILDALLARDPELPIHGFGVKAAGLHAYGDKLASADSLAWSYRARRNPRLASCTHKAAKCNGCIDFAKKWRRNIIPACPVHGAECDGRELATCLMGRPAEVAA